MFALSNNSLGFFEKKVLNKSIITSPIIGVAYLDDDKKIAIINSGNELKVYETKNYTEIYSGTVTNISDLKLDFKQLYSMGANLYYIGKINNTSETIQIKLF